MQRTILFVHYSSLCPLPHKKPLQSQTKGENRTDRKTTNHPFFWKNTSGETFHQSLLITSQQKHLDR